MSNEPKNSFYTEITRISAILLAAVIAMMAFMLVVGIQNPENNIQTILYVTLISLGLSIIASVIGNILTERSLAHAGGQSKSKSPAQASSKGLRRFRYAQQGIFIVSIISVVLLSTSLVSFLYKPKPSTPQSSQSSGSPSSGPAPGETAEQHAKESQGGATPESQPATPTPTPAP